MEVVAALLSVWAKRRRGLTWQLKRRGRRKKEYKNTRKKERKKERNFIEDKQKSKVGEGSSSS